MGSNRKKKTVVIGFVGTKLDNGYSQKRWQRWRPTVALCQQEDLVIDRFELLCSSNFVRLGNKIVDDIAQISPHTESKLSFMEIDNPWDFGEMYEVLHDFTRNYSFDPDNEEYLIHITTGTHVAQICLFLLTETRYFPAKLLQTSPPVGKSQGVAGKYSVIDLDLSRYDRLATRFHKEQQEALSILKAGIATRNKAFNNTVDEIERVALRSTAPMLITGPTGAGKSFLAKRIYQLKKERHRLSGQFVEVNCATIRGDGAMSALFGHVKGAFTGAQNQRTGWLQSAHLGLLFLDEIGELGLDEQAMLLKAIEEKKFYPVGSDKEASSDFQLIAGTNRDLRIEVKEGRFREDLFARINLWTYRLPGLSERREDIEPNLDYELERQALELTQQVRFNKQARDRFLYFATSKEAHWYGNFRDLAASVTRMMTLSEQGRITESDVEQEILRLNYQWNSLHAEDDFSLVTRYVSEDVRQNCDPFDLVQLEYVLKVCAESKNVSAAGRQVYAVSRTQRSSSNDGDRLAKYLAKFEIHFNQLHKY